MTWIILFFVVGGLFTAGSLVMDLRRVREVEKEVKRLKELSK